jgi:hypothetical protein
LYSINGKLISYESLISPLQDMLIKDDHCILATSINPSRASINANTNKQGAYVSKIIFKESFEYVLFL